MKKYYLVFIFVFSINFLMAQFTKTIIHKDGSTEIITKTKDQSLREVYSSETRNKNGELVTKKVYKRDLLSRWEFEFYHIKKAKGQTEYKPEYILNINEKGELIRARWYTERGKIYEDNRRTSAGVLLPQRLPIDFDIDGYTNYFSSSRNVKVSEYLLGTNTEWIEKLEKNAPPPPIPDYEKLRKEKWMQLEKEFQDRMEKEREEEKQLLDELEKFKKGEQEEKTEKTGEPIEHTGTLEKYRQFTNKIFRFKVIGNILNGNLFAGADGIYPDKSTLAQAVVHAGLLKVGEEGIVTVQILPGQKSYKNAPKNGVGSFPCDEWPGSFKFVHN